MEKVKSYPNSTLDQETRGKGATVKESPEVTMSMATAYLKTKKTAGKLIGLGAALCILGAIALAASQLLLRDAQAVLLNEPNDLFVIGLVVMLILVAGGAALFIYSGKLESSYKYLEEPFSMDSQVKQQLQNEWESVKSGNRATIITGVCLCVFSLIPTIIGVLVRDQNIFALGIGVCLTLLIVACAVYFLVKAASILDAYRKLLELERFEPAKKEARRHP